MTLIISMLIVKEKYLLENTLKQFMTLKLYIIETEINIVKRAVKDIRFKSILRTKINKLYKASAQNIACISSIIRV